ISLGLANSRGGFLLLDEAENGIHYSVQPRFWEMVLHTAERHGIQVFATTHSFDCVRGFAEAAIANRAVQANLVRLDRDEEGIRAVPYSEEGLKAAADQGIEVR
ncbi:MAG: AAA family ATPase, partial [Gammaproteobacteria bacterium]|nr:AAA family ATPase [Gammaproteobacteria bacterium]